MCGIWATFGCVGDLSSQYKEAYKIAHLGHDDFRLETIYQFPSCCLGFYRLAILDVHHGMQPMRVSKHPHIWLIYNGEIYNHMDLREQYNFQYDTNCDGEVIIHPYVQGGIEFAAKHLDGVFAFCLLDTANRKVYIGRDTFGVKPLFRILTADGVLSLCSELKGLMDIVDHQSKSKIQHLHPGHLESYSLDSKCQVSFDNLLKFHEIGDIPSHGFSQPIIGVDTKANIRTLLQRAVSKRMMSERRIGCLLSGGVDSSLVTALLVSLAKERGLPYPIQTFSIGMKESPDLKAARKVAKHLGTEHHEIVFTPEEGIAAIDIFIMWIKMSFSTYTAMYLLCKYVKQTTDTTVILSGEGADEVAQGYIYFHKAPSVEEGDIESRRLCKDISMFDIQRVDRMSAAFGLEIRVPFLDHHFSSYYLSLDPEIKSPQNGVEKHLLRSAFDDTDLVPRDILWRPKEGFSDGLSSQVKSWFEILQDVVEENINDFQLDDCIQRYPNNNPFSKESLYYRQIFEKFYPGQGHLIPYFWMAKWSTSLDPSARTLKHYEQ
ncbi:asparagine synthetase [glutamine-hydrolyzing]-like [Ylistrum balloti]|uniref:asparagine synthetase [glutamine-hydrolyzing]-like n=1 Tax=Ylistrum balloti TaxID=509963 RepID=UPI002905B801|nr:asparagine synthetase [glutamine-hydrolyzing]-like [Ylistrum balloti]